MPSDDRLQTHAWLRRYETGLHDLVGDFYVPALSRAVQYDRKAGFFSSSALACAATGIARLLANDGKMRLLVGVKLSADDTEAISHGYRERDEVIREALRRAWTLTEDEIARNRLGAMAEMVACGLLEIRVVAPTDEYGNPLPDDVASGMFHEKSGIFTDDEGNQVVFVGSINESETAWKGRNIEHFHVFCSWRDDAEHAGVQIEDFERLWNNKHPRALTLPFPDALREGLLELRLDEPPQYDPEEKDSPKARAIALERERWLVQFLRDAPLLENGQALVESLSALSPWPHQSTVWRRSCQDYHARWHLLCDEVGLGKTIEAGLILRGLMLPGIVRRVLLLVPKNLIKQWQQELREKFNLWAYWYTGNDYIDPTGRKVAGGADGWNAEYPIIIASAHLARRRGRMDELLSAREWDLVLADEAHHARRSWGPGEHRPNRMLRLLEGLKKRTKALQLMTATPMQVDVRELWDLLCLCGMSGRWSANLGADFRQYFLTLRAEEWSRDELAYLLGMTNSFFAAGGKPDQRLKERFKGFQGGTILWSQLTSPKRVASPARVDEMLQTLPNLHDLLVEFLQAHTPVREFMFRHTRETLRRYRAQGLLRANVASREVHDEFIPLGPAQELYDRIEQYISEKYRKAEMEKRSALGYVMTIYRQRLTSSPWAISETLRKRLERTLAQTDDETDIEDGDELADEDEDELAEEGPLDVEALWDEVKYIEQFMVDLRAQPIDPKLKQLLRDLQALRNQHPQVVIFTQYTDTMDFLREELVRTYGAQVACYSGRGGETWDPATDKWMRTTKESIKGDFHDRRIGLLVCTEAASEGLNLQSSDLLINYDMPWNPMRVEQRIGRIDRIGQASDIVHIINYYYEGSVEAQIYDVLRDRLDVFQVAVGPLQPVLGGIAKRIERAAMTDPIERSLTLDREREALGEEIERAKREGIDVDALAETELVPVQSATPPCRPDEVEMALLGSQSVARHLAPVDGQPGLYRVVGSDLVDGAMDSLAAFNQQILESRPDTVRHCLAWGDPLFAALLEAVPAPSANEWDRLQREKLPDGRVEYRWHAGDSERVIPTMDELRQCLDLVSVQPGEAT